MPFRYNPFSKKLDYYEASTTAYSGTYSGALPGLDSTDLSSAIDEIVDKSLIGSVLLYGATGDGVTDDTVAIQAAVTALQDTGIKLYFPPGTYKVTSTVTISGDLTIVSDSASFTSAYNIDYFTVTTNNATKNVRFLGHYLVDTVFCFIRFTPGLLDTFQLRGVEISNAYAICAGHISSGTPKTHKRWHFADCWVRSGVECGINIINYIATSTVVHNVSGTGLRQNQNVAHTNQPELRCIVSGIYFSADSIDANISFTNCSWDDIYHDDLNPSDWVTTPCGKEGETHAYAASGDSFRVSATGGACSNITKGVTGATETDCEAVIARGAAATVSGIVFLDGGSSEGVIYVKASEHSTINGNTVKFTSPYTVGGRRQRGCIATGTQNNIFGNTFVNCERGITTRAETNVFNNVFDTCYFGVVLGNDTTTNLISFSNNKFNACYRAYDSDCSASVRQLEIVFNHFYITRANVGHPDRTNRVGLFNDNTNIDHYNFSGNIIQANKDLDDVYIVRFQNNLNHIQCIGNQFYGTKRNDANDLACIDFNTGTFGDVVCVDNYFEDYDTGIDFSSQTYGNLVCTGNYGMNRENDSSEVLINTSSVTVTGTVVYKDNWPDLPTPSGGLFAPQNIDGDTTPSVAFCQGYMTLINTAPTTISDFDNGYDGLRLLLKFSDGNTTIQNNANIALTTGTDFVGSANQIIELVSESGVWRDISGIGGGISDAQAADLTRVSNAMRKYTHRMRGFDYDGSGAGFMMATYNLSAPGGTVTGDVGWGWYARYASAAGGACGLNHNNTTKKYRADTVYMARFNVSFSATATNVTHYGLTGSTTVPPGFAAGDGIAAFAVEGGNILCRSSVGGGGVIEETDSGVAPKTFSGAADYQILELEIDAGTSVRFYIDGILVATHSTQVPAASDPLGPALRGEDATVAALVYWTSTHMWTL